MMPSSPDPSPSGASPLSWATTRLPATIVQPLLSHVVRRIAGRHPTLFDRLGPHRTTDYLIDPIELPFALHLRPDPSAPLLRAVPRDCLPKLGATIQGRFLLLLQLLDSEEDGDSAFFSRGITITGNTEAVVRLRNALDDLEGSVADEVAGMFGPPGRAVLSRLRCRYTPDMEGVQTP